MARRFTDEEKAYLKKIAKGKSREEIKNLFNNEFGENLTVTQIRAFMSYYKVKSGYAPARFQKGCVRHRAEVGSTRVWKYGNTYLEKIKVADPDVWEFRSKYEWEKANGPIPDGKTLVHLDGNSLNNSIENLCVIDKSVKARLMVNDLFGTPKELMPTAIKIAELEDAAAKATERSGKRGKRE